MFKLACLAPLLCVAGFAQCDSTILDQARVLNVAHVETAAQALNAAGADVRVWTFDRVMGGNLDLMKALQQGVCRSWQASDGGMKNNLIVLMVAVKDRKVGLYYGDQWKPALDAQWNARVVSDEMKPRFRDGDYTGGFVAGLGEIQKLIESRTNVTASPYVVVQQQAAPTDLKGVQHILLLIMLAGGVCLAILAAFLIYDDRKKRRESAAASHQKAVIIEQQVVSLISKLSTDLASYSILTEDKGRVARVKAIIDGASSAYANLKQSSTADPSQEGLTSGEYLSIAQSYGSILEDLQRAEYMMNNPEEDKPRPTLHFRDNAMRSSYAATDPAPQAPATTANQSSTNVFAPIIISDPEPRYEASEPQWRAPEPPSYTSPEPDSGGSSSWGSSDSGSGGSSDWGSSSDSGSSSDFGSSDSGGGGSSDF
jgi:uncharacterized membrane protein YgcG